MKEIINIVNINSKKLWKLIQVKKSLVDFFNNYLFCIEAIETCPPESTEELSQFYQNRAATWESLVFDLIFLFETLSFIYLERL